MNSKKDVEEIEEEMEEIEETLEEILDEENLKTGEEKGEREENDHGRVPDSRDAG